MHDPADDAAVVCPLDATDVCRQTRLNPRPLLIAQPKQIPAHGPDPFQKRIRIVLSEQKVNEF
jgi:hypothetical protein